MNDSNPGKRREPERVKLLVDCDDPKGATVSHDTMDQLFFEKDAIEKGYCRVAGIDEAGRGPLAGPVVAAAVILPSLDRFKGLTDSKLLTARQREKWFELICTLAIDWAVTAVSEDEIDCINILQATRKAMKQCVEHLSLAPDYLLIDGTAPINITIPQRCIKKGDRRSLSIAAASVVAKVTRDWIMGAYHQQYPQYNFIRNKGYGTKEHLEALRTFGYCPIHRKSFRGVREITFDNGISNHHPDLFPRLPRS